MAIVMSATDLVAKCISIANNKKTLYVYGCFGAPLNARNKERYKHNYAYNEQPARQKKINNASSDTFGFDCVNLIKGILWGWNGNLNATYGGAVYASNGVPDTSANGMFDGYCTDKSSNFSNILPGEFVWMNGHIGVYIGNGLAVECTPIWKDGVQITAVGNIGGKAGYNTRTWTKHGKSKFIDYNSKPTPTPTPTPTLKFKVGDKVVVTGQLYGSSDGTNPGKKVSGLVTNITRAVAGKPYPYNTTGDLGWVAESSVSKYVEPTPQPTPPPTPVETFPFKGLIKKGVTLYKENGSPYPSATKYDRKVDVKGEKGDMYYVYGQTFKPNNVYVKKKDVTKITDVPKPTPPKVGDTVEIIATGYSNAYGTKGHTAYGIGWTKKVLRIYSGKAYPYQVGEGSTTIGFYKENALKKK